MPLNLLVPSLLRVTAERSDLHPLHSYLKPLLQTARAASQKYRVELPQILSNGGGAGEIEETMMWYALSYERADDDLWTRTTDIREGPWEDEKWRTRWLERMERREFQIQILLYFLKLSLPGHPPPLPSPVKKKSKRGLPKQSAEPSPRDCLEVFMDKLSMWQLVDGLENSSKAKGPKDMQSDWMQTFFEQTVKPQFERQLPDLCYLMRSKLFPKSPFTDSSNPSSPSSSRDTSPDIGQSPIGASTRQPSPSTTTTKALQPFGRSRSRSLSVSLAQERLDRERSVTAGPSKKRVLNREVSMSRAFKPKQRPAQEELAKKKENEIALKKETKPRDEGVTLVEATPTKPKPAKLRSTLSFAGRSQSHIFQTAMTDREDEEEWLLPGSSSPDVLLLGPGRQVEDEETVQNMMDHTPTKRSRLR
ncbi:hypothetical protein C0992_004092 [Termitomyces sp. T32_za158]|nr:hypothetical protein C0992_004092 [Termitomyces sp. T32_za158]